jgi:hemolysin III
MASHPVFTRGEETANWITHGLAAVAALVGGIALSQQALTQGDAWLVTGCIVFATTMVLLYSASAIYHFTPPHFATAKKRWQTLDYSAIYLLIAGSYTPFMLVNLRGAWGWSILGVVWGMALVGVACEATRLQRICQIRVGVYVAMGWLVLVAFKPVMSAIPSAGLTLIVLGGLAYTSGIAFFLWHRLQYHHAIWHSFVIAGSVLHYAAVLLYVVPSSVVG